MTTLTLDRRAFLELHKLAVGAYAPLTGFMDRAQAESVAAIGRLPGGALFPLPVLLDSDSTARDATRGDRRALVHEGREVGRMTIREAFDLDLARLAPVLFGTGDASHPGVRAWLARSGRFVAGDVELTDAGRDHEAVLDEPTPDALRSLFAARGWRTVAAFNTRNIPHRAHEHLIRLALEVADGVLIHPIVGPRKAGDYTTEAILTAYRAFINAFLPADRIVLAPLAIPMRYAGPREAILHALIRRNYGATHMIIGRDHAGVGGRYGRYEAQAAAVAASAELGIAILPLGGPFFCRLCDGIVSDRSCPHVVANPDEIVEVSGSLVRAALRRHVDPDPRLVRPEVLASIAGLDPFIAADE